MVVRYYSSTARETTLTNTITNASTTILVGGTVGFPATTPYTLALDYETTFEELVQVTAAAGNSLTVTRAIDGTSAGSHNAGARIRHVSSARDFADSRTHENAIEGIHGLAVGVNVVGDTSTQTLTNKALASPAVTGTITGSPGFTGTWTGSSAATAKVRLNNITDVSPVSTDHAFQVGPDSGTNIRMDGNEIMSVNAGVAATLFIQPDGGSTNFNTNLAADNVATSHLVNGAIDVNLLTISRSSATSTALNFKADADTQFRFLSKADGTLNWGPGGVTAPDAQLSRTGVGTLTASNNLVVTNNLTANNIRAGRAVLSAGPASTTTTLVVTFIPAMTDAPSVVITPDSNNDMSTDQIRFGVSNITSSGFTIRSWRQGSSATAYSWQATLNTQ